MKIVLELSWVASPNHVRVVGPVDQIPAIGDFIMAVAENPMTGYVKSRRWTFRPDKTTVDVRCWLQTEPT